MIAATLEALADDIPDDNLFKGTTDRDSVIEAVKSTFDRRSAR